MRHRFAFIFTLLLIRCATDPGSTAPITGAGSTLFTYETGEVGVVVNYQPARGRRSGVEAKAGVILFDRTNEEEERRQATGFAAGVSVTAPTGVTFQVPGCSGNPELVSIEPDTNSPPTFWIFTYSFTCTPTASISALAELVVHMDGLPDKTLNGGGTSSSGGPTTMTEHTVFVTSTTYQGNLGGLNGADSKCAIRGLAGTLTSGLSGTWRAILSTSEVSVKDRLDLTSTFQVKNTAGETVRTQPSLLWSGSISTAILYDENGSSVGATNTWTGSDADGTQPNSEDPLVETCNDWIASSPITYGYQGTANSATSTWLYNGAPACSTYKHLYCINANE